MMSFKLYELTEMYQNIYQLVNEDDVDNDNLQLALDSIEDEIELKADNMAKLIKSIEGDIEVLKSEEKRLYNKRKSLDNKIDSIKSYLENQLQAMGLKKVKTPLFTVAIQKNPPTVKFTDENLIPSKYKEETTTIKIPKKAILDDLKNGEQIEGVELSQEESLRIR